MKSSGSSSPHSDIEASCSAAGQPSVALDERQSRENECAVFGVGDDFGLVEGHTGDFQVVDGERAFQGIETKGKRLAHDLDVARRATTKTGVVLGGWRR